MWPWERLFMKKSICVFMAIALLAGSLACKIGSGTPQKPVETIPVTTEAAGSLQEKVQAAEEQAGAGGEVELVLTESEITSMVYAGGILSTPCHSLPKPWIRAIVRLALEPLLRTQKTNWGTTWKKSHSSASWSTCFLISGAS